MSKCLPLANCCRENNLICNKNFCTFIHYLRGGTILNENVYRGYYVRYDGHVVKFVLPPPIWWEKQPENSQTYTSQKAFHAGALWPMLVDGFSNQEGIG